MYCKICGLQKSIRGSKSKGCPTCLRPSKRGRQCKECKSAFTSMPDKTNDDVLTAVYSTLKVYGSDVLDMHEHEGNLIFSFIIKRSPKGIEFIKDRIQRKLRKINRSLRVGGKTGQGLQEEDVLFVDWGNK